MGPTTYNIVLASDEQQSLGDQQQQQQQNLQNLNHNHNQTNLILNLNLNHLPELITATDVATGEAVTIPLSQLANSLFSLQPLELAQGGGGNGNGNSGNGSVAVLENSSPTVFQDLCKLGKQQQQDSLFETATIVGHLTEENGVQRLLLELSDDVTRQLLAGTASGTTSTSLQSLNTSFSSQLVTASSPPTPQLSITTTNSPSSSIPLIPNIISKRRNKTTSSSSQNRRSSRSSQQQDRSYTSITINSDLPLPLTLNSTNSSSQIEQQQQQQQQPQQPQQPQQDFSAPGALLKADNSHGPRLPSLKCHKCDKVYTGKTAARDMTRHCRDHHTRPDRYQCPQCPGSFLRQENLTEHLRVHRVKEKVEREHQAAQELQLLQREQLQEQKEEAEAAVSGLQYSTVNRYALISEDDNDKEGGGDGGGDKEGGDEGDG
ncbi:PREDICTED: AF4/FMR2 family member 4-like, partial [Rhagoletis zephyria]|uniref:AF4/FMR2 family member 4-like n=1 Tax=Rhagoletis zephyria TaxID=28612 RepID=UPI0008118F31